MTNIRKISRLEICAIFIVGFLIILNTPLNLSAPAINNDDSDTASIQSNATPDPHRHSAREQIVFIIPRTEKTEITFLSTALYLMPQSAVHNESVFDIQLRAPPLQISLFV